MTAPASIFRTPGARLRAPAQGHLCRPTTASASSNPSKTSRTTFQPLAPFSQYGSDPCFQHRSEHRVQHALRRIVVLSAQAKPKRPVSRRRNDGVRRSRESRSSRAGFSRMSCPDAARPGSMPSPPRLLKAASYCIQRLKNIHESRKEGRKALRIRRRKIIASRWSRGVPVARSHGEGALRPSPNTEWDDLNARRYGKVLSRAAATDPKRRGK